MLIEWLFLINLGIFLSIIAYEDLKTSLISDKYPLSMSIIALLLYLYLCIQGECNYLFHAIIGGVVFLLLGYALYYSGQWGEGDALVLAAVIFSMPLLPHIPLHIQKYYYLWFVYFINLSLIGVVYSLIYTLYFSIRSGSKFWISLALQLKKNIKYLIIIEGTIASGYVFLKYFYGINTSKIFLLWGAVGLLSYFLYFFAKTADTALFTKKVKLKDLKEGDTVIGEFKKIKMKNKLLDAISKEDIQKLIKAYGDNYEVEVKDMVRYAPSFFLAYILTLIIGDKIVWLLVK